MPKDFILAPTGGISSFRTRGRKAGTWIVPFASDLLLVEIVFLKIYF